MSEEGVFKSDLSSGVILDASDTYNYQYGTPFVLFTFTAPTTDVYYFNTVGSSVLGTEIYAWSGATPAGQPLDSYWKLSQEVADFFGVADPSDYAELALPLDAGSTYTLGVVDGNEISDSGAVSLVWQSQSSGLTGWTTPPVGRYPFGFASYGNNYGVFVLGNFWSLQDYLDWAAAPRTNPLDWDSNYFNQKSTITGDGGSVRVFTKCFGNENGSDDWRFIRWDDDIESIHVVEWEDADNEIDRLEVTTAISDPSISPPPAGSGVRTSVLNEPLPVVNSTAESGTFSGAFVHDLIADGSSVNPNTGPTAISAGYLTVADDGKWSVSLIQAPVVFWVPAPSWFGFPTMAIFSNVELYLQRPRYRTFRPKSATDFDGVYKVRKIDGTWYTLGSGSQAKIRALDGSWYVENVSGAQAKVRLAAGSMGPGVDFGKE